MFVLSEISLQKVLQQGIANLRANPRAFQDLFGTYCQPQLDAEFGRAHIAKIHDWFMKTEIPVILAYVYNRDRFPAISIHLASDVEDEGKAAIYDFMGDNEEGELNTAVFTVQLDVGLHANRSTDQVLWLYYIVSYILFKEKRLAESLGLKLQTYSASDYSRVAQKGPDNTYDRFIRLRCTTENFWEGELATTPEDMEIGIGYDRISDESECEPDEND